MLSAGYLFFLACLTITEISLINIPNLGVLFLFLFFLFFALWWINRFNYCGFYISFLPWFFVSFLKLTVMSPWAPTFKVQSVCILLRMPYAFYCRGLFFWGEVSGCFCFYLCLTRSCSPVQDSGP